MKQISQHSKSYVYIKQHNVIIGLFPYCALL